MGVNLIQKTRKSWLITRYLSILSNWNKTLCSLRAKRDHKALQVLHLIHLTARLNQRCWGFKRARSITEYFLDNNSFKTGKFFYPNRIQRSKGLEMFGGFHCFSMLIMIAWLLPQNPTACLFVSRSSFGLIIWTQLGVRKQNTNRKYNLRYFRAYNTFCHSSTNDSSKNQIVKESFQSYLGNFKFEWKNAKFNCHNVCPSANAWSNRIAFSSHCALRSRHSFSTWLFGMSGSKICLYLLVFLLRSWVMLLAQTVII